METTGTRGSTQSGSQPRPDNGQSERGRGGKQSQSQQVAQQSASRGAQGEYLPARRQHPFAMLAQMSEEMDRLMDSFFGGRMLRTRHLGGGDGFWYPSIEVRERDNELIVCAELPGLRKEDVNIEVDADQLVISGERRAESESKEQGWYRSERSYGSFCRTVPLPEGAQTDNVQAKLRDGLLEVTVPLQPRKRQQRRIEVQQ